MFRLAGMVLICLATFAAAARAEESLAFRKPIDSDTSVVVRRTSFDARLLQPIDPGIMRDLTHASTLSVEVHRGGQQALIGSTIFLEYSDFRQGFRVLDIAIADGDVVIACATYDMVSLWKVRADIGLVPKPDGWARIVPSPFAPRSALKPADIDVQLIAPTDGVWSVKVTDKRVAGSPTTVFRQADQSWRFVAESK